MRQRQAAALLLLAAAASPALAQQGPTYPLDNSEQAAWYVERGAPSPDHAWMPNDVQRLADTLAPLSGRTPDKLPRLNSERSGSLFRRSIDIGNLDLVHSIPEEQRLAPAIQYLQANQQLVMVYSAPSATGQVLDDELAGLLGFSLDTTRLVFAIMNDMTTAMGDDPAHAERRRFIEQIRGGLAAATAGMLTPVGESDTYRPAARAVLIAALERNLPAISGHLTAAQRAENDATLGDLVANEPDAALKTRLSELRTLVAGA